MDKLAALIGEAVKELIKIIFKNKGCF